MSLKPTIKIKSPKRFRLQQIQQRLNEQWSRAFLIDEIYIQLMSIKYRDSEGILIRKYVEIVKKEMGWMPVPPHTTVKVSLADLDDKIKAELSKEEKTSQDFIMKEAVGKICEAVDSRTYLINAIPFLRVELVD